MKGQLWTAWEGSITFGANRIVSFIVLVSFFPSFRSGYPILGNSNAGWTEGGVMGDSFRGSGGWRLSFSEAHLVCILDTYIHTAARPHLLTRMQLPILRCVVYRTHPRMSTSLFFARSSSTSGKPFSLIIIALSPLLLTGPI